jgi:hypothetical protein
LPRGIERERERRERGRGKGREVRKPIFSRGKRGSGRQSRVIRKMKDEGSLYRSVFATL